MMTSDNDRSRECTDEDSDQILVDKRMVDCETVCVSDLVKGKLYLLTFLIS